MDTQVPCSKCGDAMVAGDIISQPKGPTIHYFKCSRCELQAAVLYEPLGGMDDRMRTWVEQEISSKGSWFPADYGPNAGGFRRRDF